MKVREKYSEREVDYSIGIYGGISLAIIFGSWVFTYYALKGETDRGTFGDMFGGLNALFSGLAFAGIIITILLQRKDLSLQKAELKATRNEFIIQNDTLKLQRFESTFFNLVNLHNQIIAGMDLETYPEVTITGRDVFEKKYEEMVSFINTDSKEEFNRTYTEFYDTVQADFGHYFRNLYRIIKFVDEYDFVPHRNMKTGLSSGDSSRKKMDEETNYIERYKYISIIRAQLSYYELLWLFYNCLSDLGKKFKPLLEKYSLLKNLPMNRIKDQKLLSFYEAKAFEKE